MKIDLHCQNNFQLSVESHSELPWFCFILICDWSRKLAPYNLNQSDWGQNRPQPGNSRFPALKPFVYFYSRVSKTPSLAPFDIILCFDWLVSMLKGNRLSLGYSLNLPETTQVLLYIELQNLVFGAKQIKVASWLLLSWPKICIYLFIFIGFIAMDSWSRFIFTVLSVQGQWKRRFMIDKYRSKAWLVSNVSCWQHKCSLSCSLILRWQQFVTWR